MAGMGTPFLLSTANTTNGYAPCVVSHDAPPTCGGARALHITNVKQTESMEFVVDVISILTSLDQCCQRSVSWKPPRVFRMQFVRMLSCCGFPYVSRACQNTTDIDKPLYRRTYVQ